MIRPMLASLIDAPLDDPNLVYEPKYDGIRAIAEIGGLPPSVRLWSRLGNEKTNQFPEIAAALAQWAKKLKEPLVVDGEIVALDEKGEPTGFQNLQGRIHLTDASVFSPSRRSSPSRPEVAFIAFDILWRGRTDYRDRPLLERRAALERLFRRGQAPLRGDGGQAPLRSQRGACPPVIRISQMVRGDGRALYQEAVTRGWEGLIAKHAHSRYKSGKRTPDWRKIKIVHEQEFVVGGWTEPRQTRSYFGALLLGVYDSGPQPPASSLRLIYVGHTGTGFNEKELARLMNLLKARETDVCPFKTRPKTNERPHWVRPELVAQVKFTEWTTDGKLRHPVYLGLRDDKTPSEVTREDRPRIQGGPKSQVSSPKSQASRLQSQVSSPASTLVDQLTELEKVRKDGVLQLPGGVSLKVTNLHKVFWPKQKLTKGDLFRYYARVAPFVLPAVADRPLVMKRFPNGVAAPPFYQHRVEDVPAGVRTGVVSVVEQRPQIVGGDLIALMYTTQLAAISQDPWFSRVQHPQFADDAALDLDPSEGVPFPRVLDVARWIHDELDGLGAMGVPKTSGADGLHVYIPLPPGTPYDAGMLYCQIVATLVAHKHPKVATVERSVKARGPRVYIDCLQNILGKTLATAYSARASEYAGVSTPLTWKEIAAGVDRRDFTIQTVPARLEQIGDLWAALRKSKGVDLERVTRYGEGKGTGRLKGDTS